MQNRQSPIHWSFSCGTWAGTDVRISVFIPLLLVLICWRLGDLRLGLALCGVYAFSILFHEAAHIFAVRATGGSGDEILLWPLGGLASVYPASSFRSQFFTPAAGPMSNLLLCLLVAVPVLNSPYAGAVFHPFVLPVSGLSGSIAPELLALTFWVNWILLLLNLLPVYPLDGGRMVQACLATRFRGESATNVYLKIGVVVGFIGFIAGMVADSTWIVAISAMVLLLNLQESFMMQTQETYDDSFLGYDFSQGYTSLEREADEKPSAKRKGVLQRWRERRKSEKERRLAERDAEVQAELDGLLQKIQDHGIESLSEAERRKLKRAADLFKEKGKST